MTMWPPLLERARTELEVARVLLDAGFGAQAVSRASFATLYSAEAALMLLGEHRSKHSGVISAFGRLVVREGGLSQDVGRLLRALFEARKDADDMSDDLPKEVATRLLDDARRFVDATEAWCHERAG